MIRTPPSFAGTPEGVRRRFARGEGGAGAESEATQSGDAIATYTDRVNHSSTMEATSRMPRR
jgi:hypothetical protein